MTYLWDLFDADKFWELNLDGYIRVQHHPEFPLLSIANYAEKTVFDRNWTPETKAARGLIFNNATGKVVARPFPKFFNHGEVNAAVPALNERVWTYDKLDGSLGIIYEAPDGTVRVASRGSFASEQAVRATSILHTKYSGWIRWFASSPELQTHTPIVEIIYPANRIVVDYGSMEDLVLLGHIGIKDGVYVPPEMGNWDGPRAQGFDHDNWSQVLAEAPRPGKEGFVVYLPEQHDWVKVKQEDYIELHRIVTGLSARRVYEALRGGQTVRQICEPLPDEFHQFVLEVADEIDFKLKQHHGKLECEFFDILEDLEERGITRESPEFRKEFALLAKETGHLPMMFCQLDGKSIRDSVWKMFEPTADWVPGNHDQYKGTL